MAWGSSLFGWWWLLARVVEDDRRGEDIGAAPPQLHIDRCTDTELVWSMVSVNSELEAKIRGTVAVTQSMTRIGRTLFRRGFLRMLRRTRNQPGGEPDDAATSTDHRLG